ncbi:MAG: phosphotransferase family protein [Acidimicrobiaceae bacterium]|nr:phosphotransferase family protein [Acidimicrobiaceae bacterium]
MSAELANALAVSLQGALGDVKIQGLKRLSAGASRETWSFDAVASDESHQLILQRHRSAASQLRGGLDEPELLRCALAGGVRVPQIVASDTSGENSIGAPFMVSRRIQGESIPRKILRDDSFAGARRGLVADFGRELAAIHRLEMDSGDQITAIDDPLAVQRMLYEAFDDPHPVFDLAFRWLDQCRPQTRQPCVVHGDFRMGNILVDSGGLAAVLDWELAYIGNPAFDLGWLVARAWRFGEVGEVGGVGTRSELLDAYRANGGAAVTLEELRWWEMLACLRWGVVTMAMVADHRQGRSSSMEQAVIGRRVVETEYDVMLLLRPEVLGKALA